MVIVDKFTQDFAEIDFEAGAIILVDKPLEWTSFDVVNKIRYRLSQRYEKKRFKVGHNGTLDPLATGLLMIFVGKYTKMIPKMEHETKRYLGTIKFGATTESLDKEKPEIEIQDASEITKQEIFDKLDTFLGEQMQEIPKFSAQKINGKRMYKMARKNIDFKPRVKPVVFHELDLLDYTPPLVEVDILCGKGTYIRSFARDLGSSLGTSAYLYVLVRTAIGEFSIDRAMDVETCCNKILEMS